MACLILSALFLYTGGMATDREVEIKFRIDDIEALTASLQTSWIPPGYPSHP